MNKKPTFREIYRSIDNTSPKTKWLRDIAKVTMSSEFTVRMWVQGRQTPDSLCQSVIAKYLGVSPKYLFPETETPKTNNYEKLA